MKKPAGIAAVVLLGAAIAHAGSGAPGGTAAAGLVGGAPGTAARAGIPADYLAWYTNAARTCPGLPWPVLAGVGEVESDHGRSGSPGVHSGANYAGAEGPMQFLPSTFAQYATGPDQPLTPYDPADAIYTAARLLCDSGARGGSQDGVRRAIYAYNHAGWYVTDVLAWAGRYASPGQAAAAA